MDNAERTVDRTIELPVPGQSPPGAGGTAPAAPPPNAAPASPSVMPTGNGGGAATGAGSPGGAAVYPAGTPGGGNGGGGGSLEDRIPEGMTIKRPSPALDPIRRAAVSRAAKWGLLAAILLGVLWFPGYLWAGDKRAGYFLALVTAAATLAAVLAVGVPRLVLPRVFGRWHEAVEAARDWLLVGVLTGVLYWIGIQVANVMRIPAPITTQDWIVRRLPLLFLAGVIGMITARTLAIRREGVAGGGIGGLIGLSVLQAILLTALERPIERFLDGLYRGTPGLTPLLGGLALLSGVAAIGTVLWAAQADASLTSVRRRRGASGFDDGTGPVNLTMTVIGGRESGKTVLLAAAFYEWSTQNIGDLRITPAADAVGPDGTRGGVANLEEVARELYVNNQFPVGTVSTQNLPFDLSIGNEKVARFTFLDYPGGAIAGRVADNRVVQEFWERVEDTDGIILIADMSYVRRAHKDADWLEVRNAYRTVMQRLVDRNGKRRVVPVALVLTKCDEFVDPTTGHIDMNALTAGLREFQYDELEAEWRQLNEKAGPGFAEFQTFITSAITYSQPQLGPSGRPDYSKPFMIAPPPPTITPTGCASPLLWICAKVMRWNVTAFYDISSFLFGSSPRVRRRVEGIQEMERIAEQRAGRA